MTDEEYKKLREKVETGARAGKMVDQWSYGNFLMVQGKTYEQYKEGLGFLIKSANQDFYDAQIDLARVYFYGKGTDKDINRSFLLCERALLIIDKLIQMRRQRDPNADVSNLLISRYKAMWIRDTIKKLSEIPHNISEAQMTVFRSIDNQDLGILERALDENVVLSSSFKQPIVGIKEVLKWFEDVLSKKDLQISFVPTERYGMVVELYVPNSRATIRRLIFTKTNKNGKIERIACQLNNGECFAPGSEPFTWEEIEPCLNDLSPGYGANSAFVRGRMFCMGCGKLSHELRWIKFRSNPALHDGITYIGTMSVCTDCRRQVELSFDECKV